MKPQRISSKDYDELLKIMRKWPDPYRGMVAKLVNHIGWMFDENKRLDDRLKKLEQTGLADEAASAMSHFPGSKVLAKNEAPKPAAKVFLTTAQILKGIAEISGTDSPEWRRALKYKALSHDDAIKLIKAIDNL